MKCVSNEHNNSSKAQTIDFHLTTRICAPPAHGLAEQRLESILYCRPEQWSEGQLTVMLSRYVVLTKQAYCLILAPDLNYFMILFCKEYFMIMMVFSSKFSRYSSKIPLLTLLKNISATCPKIKCTTYKNKLRRRTTTNHSIQN